MTFEDVRKKQHDKHYATKELYTLTCKLKGYNTILDENKSVVWNREQVEVLNKPIREQIEQIHEYNANQHELFYNDLTEAAASEYSINKEQAQLILNHYRDTTDYDYICRDFIDEYQKLVQVFVKVLTTK